MNGTTQRLNVSFTITWEGNWHVGSGHATAGVDRLLRRRASGPRNKRTAFVPGSQIKGVLRHQCERLASLLGAVVVSPHDISEQTRSDLINNFRPLARSELLVDRLFGSRFQGDCLFVEDALPTSGAEKAGVLHSRSAIDRVSKTARHQGLFVTEVASGNGAVLRSQLQARHAAGALTQEGSEFPFEYALLLASLLSIESLGGDKSSGLGRCRVTVPETVHWNDDRKYPLSKALQSFEDEEWFEWVTLVRQESQG